MARLWALVTQSMSPVRRMEIGVSGMHWARPPPAAEPLMLNVGPPLGWRMAPQTRLPSLPSPSIRPIVVVVLPSPSGVGVIAVTSMYLAVGRVAQPGQDLLIVHLGELVPIRDQLVVVQAEFAGEPLNRLHAFLSRLGDLPILHYTRVKIHQPKPALKP